MSQKTAPAWMLEVMIMLCLVQTGLIFGLALKKPLVEVVVCEQQRTEK